MPTASPAAGSPRADEVEEEDDGGLAEVSSHEVSTANAHAKSKVRTEERAMKPIVKTLLRRALLTLGGIFVWAKALAGGSRGDRQKPAEGQKPKR